MFLNYNRFESSRCTHYRRCGNLGNVGRSDDGYPKGGEGNGHQMLHCTGRRHSDVRRALLDVKVHSLDALVEMTGRHGVCDMGLK
jgi:hypothetical protein